MKPFKTIHAAAFAALTLINAGCVVEVAGGPSTVFSDNFDTGGGRWTLGDGFSVDIASGTDRWLRAVYDDTCSDQTYNFAYITAPFNFAGASAVSVSLGTAGRYGAQDSTGVAWTTDPPSPSASWNSVLSFPTGEPYTVRTVDLPAEARRPGVYLGIYFRNVCVRNSVGVNMGYDDVRVVVTR